MTFRADPLTIFDDRRANFGIPAITEGRSIDGIG